MGRRILGNSRSAARGALAGALAVISTLLASTYVAAQPIEIVPCPNVQGCGTFAFRDNRKPNTIGLVEGDRIAFGLFATPNPGPDNSNAAGRDTRVEATQGSAGPVNLGYIFSPAAPNEFFSSVAYDSAFTGPWTLTITNPNSPNSPLQVMTPAVGTVPKVEFVRSMSLPPGPSSARPTFTWTLPAEDTFTHSSVYIWDLTDRTPTGGARLVHKSPALPLSATSYTPPEELLEEGNRYSVAVQLDQRRSDGLLLSRSRSIYEFQTVPDGTPTVVLPSVDPDGVYHFDVEVVDGQIVFIDPPVAIGYDYATGPGDPRFTSVTLPEGIGDDAYELWLFDASGRPYLAARLTGGENFQFASLGLSAGVDRFRILGIEVGAGLDPIDVTAFVTGLTFAGDGAFTGTMTPITHDTEDRLLSALGPAELYVGLRNSDDIGARFDLRAEVHLDGTLIASGQRDNVPGGGSGFNNARRSAVPLELIAGPISVSPGSQLSVTLSARIACTGTTHASATARLWFGDAHATSGFSATVDDAPTGFYLQAGSELADSPGSSSRMAIDRRLDSKVRCQAPGGRPFTPFGTWSIALP